MNAEWPLCYSPASMKLQRLGSIALFVLLTAMIACSGSLSSTVPSPWTTDNSPLTSPGPLTNAPEPLNTPTYDGSGQTVEPTVLYFPESWRGFAYWMIVSPYPFYDNDTFENPSILVSPNGQDWTVPSGLTNPIALPTDGVFADASGVFDDESKQLFVYFLNDVPSPVYEESLLRVTSSDGIHWSAPRILISGQGTFVNSPSVTKVNNTFQLWSVDTNIGCGTQNSTVNQRTSLDGVNWSAPQPLNISQPGYVIWHLNVIAVPSKGQYMSLLAAYPLGSYCGKTVLFFANSHDGINWQTYPQPVLRVGAGWDSGEIYRSSLLYDPDTALLRVWYSASDDVSGVWHVGYSQENFPVQ
jgi:hypothetical protein